MDCPRKASCLYSSIEPFIFGALAHLFEAVIQARSWSAGVLIGYLRPPDQAHAAIRLLDERSKSGSFSAKTFHDLQVSLKTAVDLATNDFRFPGMVFDLPLYVEKVHEDPTTTDVRAGLWSCLNVTQEADNIEVFALEYLQAAISLSLSPYANLRMDDERLSAAQKTDFHRRVWVWPDIKRPYRHKPRPTLTSEFI